MLYELHLTTTPGADVDKWVALCNALAIKPLVIELDTGVHPRQVMTAGTHTGDVHSAYEWSYDLMSAFDAAGFPIIREKLEVPLDKADEASTCVYHEAHIKMLLEGEDVEMLPAIARHSNMHASRNALQADVNGRAKWYLTRRAYGCDIRTAADQFGEAFRAVHECLPAARMEMETVLSDSNSALDIGWAV